MYGTGVFNQAIKPCAVYEYIIRNVIHSCMLSKAENVDSFRLRSHSFLKSILNAKTCNYDEIYTITNCFTRGHLHEN